MARKQGSSAQSTRAGALGASRAEADGRGSAATDLTSERLLGMYRVMVTTRAVDERMWLLQRQGAIAFTIPCKGQEAAQIGAVAAFDPARDWFYPYYRDVGVVLSLGMTPKDVFLAGFGRLADPTSGGRQMPYHWSLPSAHIVTQSSPVATQIPHAAGTAMALQLRGEDGVVYCSFGEGSSSEGDFHEGVNFAAVRKAPVVFFCENNHYAISVPTDKQMAVHSVAERAPAYGIPGESVDGNDVVATYEAVKRAVDRARAGEGPTLIEARTYRIMAHSSGDDDRNYRSREEIAEWAKRDPLQRFREYLVGQGLLDEARDQALRAEVAEQVDAATDAAEQAPAPGLEEAMRYVFADPTNLGGVNGRGR
ncbi:MAG TPA: thiamine pyrophosphate-dependent dehydrogenase E1 component subunit alpha [Bacillota bacterium]|nr:thiamine pyrophosphate-dependent dehydrogenase E1 component subunit alpha [Bacillota bacterium]